MSRAVPFQWITEWSAQEDLYCSFKGFLLPATITQASGFTLSSCIVQYSTLSNNPNSSSNISMYSILLCIILSLSLSNHLDGRPSSSGPPPQPISFWIHLMSNNPDSTSRCISFSKICPACIDSSSSNNLNSTCGVSYVHILGMIYCSCPLPCIILESAFSNNPYLINMPFIPIANTRFSSKLHYFGLIIKRK